MIPLRIVFRAECRQRILREIRSLTQEATVSTVAPVITDGNDILRFGSSALNANEYNGRVNVNRWSESNLANSYDNEGGRVAEAIQDTKMPRQYGAFLLWIQPKPFAGILFPYS